MPSAFLNEINRTFLQVIPVLVEFVAIVWLAAWVSERFIATLPDDVPEKAELLQGARNRWFIWAPLASLALMYAMIVYALAPLSGVVLGAFVLLLPILLMAYANPAALDAPSAAVEVLRARLRRQAADPERWVARYRLLKARRQRLGLLKWAMAALMALLVVMGVYGYVTVDRVLAMRLRAQVVVEALRADLSTSFEGTIFSETPPCVPLRTMHLIPGKDLSKAQAQKYVGDVVKWFGVRGERWPWQVRVKMGDGPPLAEGEYAGRR